MNLRRPMEIRHLSLLCSKGSIQEADPPLTHEIPFIPNAGMRIVHWAPQFGSETGTGKAIAGWLDALSSRGRDCTVVSPPVTAEFRETCPRIQVRSHRSPFQRLRILGQEIKTSHIVHLHGAFDLKLCAAHAVIALEKMWRMFTGQPLHIVMTPHGALADHVFTTRPHLKWLYMNFIERSLAKQTSLAVCNTMTEADTLRKLIPRSRVEVVPLVVTGEEMAAAATEPAPSGKPPLPPILCTLGRYDIQIKGLDLLIGAVKKLYEAGYPVRLRCIGYDEGGGTKKLEEYVKSVGAEDLVECAGPRFGAEKFQAIAECDVFCMPSRYESFSYALLEGLASGKPVLVGSGACLTGFFDPTQKQAMVVEPETAAWERAIRNTLANPGANTRCAGQALADLRNSCSPASVGDSLGGYYDSLFDMEFENLWREGGFVPRADSH